MNEEEVKFEPALKRLEEIVESLEKDDLDLEKSLQVFEEGIAMSRICSKHLDEAEKKIELLLKDKEGNREIKPFEEEKM